MLLCLSQAVFFFVRHLKRRSAKSMNFDNPVYRKTTDDDQVSLNRTDSGISVSPKVLANFLF